MKKYIFLFSIMTLLCFTQCSKEVMKDDCTLSDWILGKYWYIASYTKDGTAAMDTIQKYYPNYFMVLDKIENVYDEIEPMYHGFIFHGIYNTKEEVIYENSFLPNHCFNFSKGSTVDAEMFFYSEILGPYSPFEGVANFTIKQADKKAIVLEGKGPQHTHTITFKY